MIAESKRIEFWNFLTAEKNQPRPRGITTQRLAVIKGVMINSDDLWLEVIENYGAGNLTAVEFYGSNEIASNLSRTAFWSGVKKAIADDKNIRDHIFQKSCRNSKTSQKSISRNRLFK